MSFPSPITGLKLRVSTGSDSYEQPIPSASMNGNSFRIMPNTVVFNAFNNNPAGTIFTPSIVTSYGSDESGNAVSAVSTPSVVANFIARQIIPNLSLAAFTNKLTTDSPFSLSVTSLSDGVLTFSSSDTSVATVNSSRLVTIVGAGTTTITVNLAASANGIYTAASVTRQLVVTVPVAPKQIGFSVLTGSDFASLDFNSGMTTLFPSTDDNIFSINMPNSNFMFNSAAYTTLYASSNGWFSFGKVQTSNSSYNNQQPTETLRYFGWDHESTGSYKFVSNNTRLLFKLSGFFFDDLTKTFTIKVIIEQSGEIRINYTLASTYISDPIIIGYIGSNSSTIADDVFLTLNGSTFNSVIYLNLFSLLNGKSILYTPPNYPIFGTFTLPTDIQVYQNQIITRVLTPPTSNSLGAFTFTSSNTAVAIISLSGGVYSINVIGGGTTTITAIQAASGDFASSSVTASLSVTVVLPTFGTFSLPTDIQVYKNQTITRVLTPPTSNSSGAFTFTSTNTDVATISISGGVYSINVIGLGTTTITAIQAVSAIYASKSTTAVLFVTLLYPTFGSFTLPSDELIYQNQTITRVLTPPTSNSSGAFTFTSSNTAVATISVDSNSVSSINVIGAGSTIIGVVQADSGDYVSSSIAVLLNTVTGTSFSAEGVLWSQKGGDIDGEAAYDYSGQPVSLSSDGNIVAIGAVRNDGNGVDSGHVRVYIRDTNVALGWKQLGGDIDGEAANDLSAYSVDLSSDGTTLAIGAPLNDGNGSNSGHVRVYKYNPTKTVAQLNQSLAGFGPVGWDLLGADIDGEAAGDQSGISVSLSSDGTIVAIGANVNSGNGSNSGHVRVYKYNSSKSVAQLNQSLPGFGPVGWDRLGGDIDGEAAYDLSARSVSLSSDGTILAIGAERNGGNGGNSGHVRVYKYNPSKSVAQLNQSLAGFGPVGWDLLGSDIDGEAVNDSSGYSVSLSSDGTIVAIGARYNGGNGSGSGHVRVYKYNPSKSVAQLNQSLAGFGPVGWDRLGSDIDGEAVDDLSGWSVSLSSDGNIVAIGTPGNNGNGSDSGHVRVYIRDTNKTTAQINPSLPNFGPIGWTRLGADINGEAVNDYSGNSVSLSSDGTIVAIAAPWNDINGTDSGNVRVFKLQ